jgi:hypothetical protein
MDQNILLFSFGNPEETQPGINAGRDVFPAASTPSPAFSSLVVCLCVPTPAL